MRRGVEHPSGDEPRLTPAVLGAVWPDLRARLRRALLRSGADADSVDDAIAEAVTRALARQVRMGSADDLSRWLYVAARNVLIDGSRKQHRVVPLVDVPEQHDGYDVAVHVEHRQRLRATARAFADLSAADQDAIRAGVSPVEMASSVTAGAVAVRRHRARSRLRDVVGAPIGILVRVRWLPGHAPVTGRAAWAASMVAPLMLASGAIFPGPSPGMAEPPPTVGVIAIPPPQEAISSSPARPGVRSQRVASRLQNNPTVSGRRTATDEPTSTAARAAVKGGVVRYPTAEDVQTPRPAITTGGSPVGVHLPGMRLPRLPSP